MTPWLWILVGLAAFLAVPIIIGHYLHNTFDYYDHEDTLDP